MVYDSRWIDFEAKVNEDYIFASVLGTEKRRSLARKKTEMNRNSTNQILQLTFTFSEGH